MTNPERLAQSVRDIDTVLRVEGTDLEMGSRKLLKEVQAAIRDAREALAAHESSQQAAHDAGESASIEEWEQELSAVMPADFKDWWQNSKREWPAVAAAVIRSQRADRDLGWEMAAKAAPAAEPLTLDAFDEHDPVVGHKTLSDGSHVPLLESEAKAIWAAAEAAQAKRAADMPTEEDAVRAMWSAYQRLRELGWKETKYGPTKQSVRLIEPGSAGIHTGSRWEQWPEKTWWVGDDGDLWPSTPCLFKPLEAKAGNTGEVQHG